MYSGVKLSNPTRKLVMPDAAKDHNATRIWQETYLKEKWRVPPIIIIHENQ